MSKKYDPDRQHAMLPVPDCCFSGVFLTNKKNHVREVFVMNRYCSRFTNHDAVVSIFFLPKRTKSRFVTLFRGSICA